MITLTDVTKFFPGAETPAVDRLSLSIAQGELVTLVGPSGCGKTTTLKMINRIVEPTSGRIELAGEDTLALPAHELRRSIGYVIQQIGLFPHRTVAQNIATVPNLLGWRESETKARVLEMAELVGLDVSLLSRFPAELSGGQQQRVGVARALAADPPVLLMDEPFGAVDPIVRGRLQTEFRALQSRLGKTVVFVTHDIDEALGLGDRVAIMNTGGVVEQFGSPMEILAEPANDFVETFIGGERGLKRLALMAIDPSLLEPGPMVEAGAPAAEAHRVMALYDVDWFGVLQEDRLLGWATAAELGDHDIADLDIRPVHSSVPSTASLREALDVVVTGHNRLALVVDDGVFRGVLDIEAIARDVTE